MSKTLRVVLVATVVVATLVYTLLGSQFQGEESILNVNFWSLISIPLILGFGIWWILKANP